jgi:phosphoserine phosphatase RsbU/P
MFQATRYHTYYHTFKPGEILVLYTDGVTEAMNAEGEEFGRDRLVAAVKDASELGARELVASMQRSVLEWTDGMGSSDDATFFVIKALK